MSSREFTIALVGNPNCGKTAIFNALTGGRQRVGNWPGVTVEKKLGHFYHRDHKISVVDLPGVYSTNVSSDAGALDEKIACQYLFSGEVDLMVNIIDASNLERNLYLTLQLLEMKIPTILAVNMMDVVEKRGISIHLGKLSQLLDCPVVGLVAHQHKGIDALKNKIVQLGCAAQVSHFDLPLPPDIQQAIQSLAPLLSVKDKKHQQWLAMRLLEGDHFVAHHVDATILNLASEQSQIIEKKLSIEADILIAKIRYSVIKQILPPLISRTKMPQRTLTQKLDRVVLNRFLGVPIFLVVMYLMFLFSINVGGAFQDFFDISSTTIFVDGFAHLLTMWHIPGELTALLTNGIGKGINTTLTFIPVIASMFLFLSFLEDSGYMARAAFVMDRLMRALGLPGKSFIPMIVGFGCNVPAVMGTRTLENRRDRILTVMMMPFMSCGARLAIFAVFASAFFPHGGALIVFILYLLGILIAVVTGLVLRKTVLPGKPAPLVMELPSYHLPRLGSLWRQVWQRLKSFLSRASRVIIPVSVILGMLNSVSVTGQSLLSTVGRVITPIFSPMGIDQNNWPATVGLTTGVLAKEVVIGTLNTLYSQQAHITEPVAAPFNWYAGLRNAVLSIPQNLRQLGGAFKNPVAASQAPHDMNQTAYGIMYQEFSGKIGAFAYLLFVLLYFPCVSTMAVMRREIGTHWALFSVLWSTGLAYVLAVMSYQGLTLMAHPVSSLLWILSGIGTLLVAIVVMRRYASSDRYRKIAVASQRNEQGKSPLGCGVRCQMCKTGLVRGKMLNT